ncbi:purine nucleoside phosphorylase LACC1 [Tiliqua scincoides]|uniref:purine nucleoside phosphorylase LACC1 n=1 Tax=Tiliqua scincoides TaxID=71010 RepID=UPI0034633C11
MAKAVIIDLCSLRASSWNTAAQESLSKTLEAVGEDDAFHTPFVYLICCRSLQTERKNEDVFHMQLQSFHCPQKGLEVVCAQSTVAALYYIKQKLDEKGISHVQIILPLQGKPSMREFIGQLFTSVYQFEFKDLQVNCGENHLKKSTKLQNELVSLTDQDVEMIQTEIKMYLENLPGLKGELTILKSLLIPDHIFQHGFTTRAGGISYIPSLSSFNLFSSSKRRDPPAVVRENLRRLAIAAGFDQDTYHTVKVNHASDVWVMGKARPDSYDGIVTNQRGVTIAAPGADCIPVLFADPVKKACGAAHSGWQGTLLGVSMAVVNAMVTEYGCDVKDIRVVLGPSVGPCCFTLPQESAKKFHRIDPKCVRRYESSRPYVDIRRATRVFLETGGILPENIQDDSIMDQNQNLTLCTSCYPDKFYSHVRDGENFGTQIGFISIKD